MDKEQGKEEEAGLDVRTVWAPELKENVNEELLKAQAQLGAARASRCGKKVGRSIQTDSHKETQEVAVRMTPWTRRGLVQSAVVYTGWRQPGRFLPLSRGRGHDRSDH